MPPDPLVSRDFVAPNGRSRAHIANILNYATPGLTNKKRLGTPLKAALSCSATSDTDDIRYKVKRFGGGSGIIGLSRFLIPVLFYLNDSSFL